jgi:hypothetical protein
VYWYVDAQLLLERLSWLFVFACGDHQGEIDERVFDIPGQSISLGQRVYWGVLTQLQFSEKIWTNVQVKALVCEIGSAIQI